MSSDASTDGRRGDHQRGGVTWERLDVLTSLCHSGRRWRRVHLSPVGVQSVHAD